MNGEKPMSDCKFISNYLIGTAKEEDILYYMIPWLKGEINIPLATYIGLEEGLLQWWHYEPKALKHIAVTIWKTDPISIKAAEEAQRRYVESYIVALNEQPMQLLDSVFNKNKYWPDEIITMYYEKHMTLAQAWREYKRKDISEIAKKFKMTDRIYMRLEAENYYPYILKKAIANAIGINATDLNPMPYKPWTEETRRRYQEIQEQADKRKKKTR